MFYAIQFALDQIGGHFEYAQSRPPMLAFGMRSVLRARHNCRSLGAPLFEAD